MRDDLAGRLMDGALAVLELVPGERRFTDLSRQVLRAGASTFESVVSDHERIRYVLPVGVPAGSLEYGALIIQDSRCSLAWTVNDAAHGLICELDPDTTVTQSPAHVRGETWGRFDLNRAGHQTMTFLVPPVAAVALPKLLHRVLVLEPACQLSRGPVAELPDSVLNPTAPSASAVVDAPTSMLQPVLESTVATSALHSSDAPADSPYGWAPPADDASLRPESPMWAVRPVAPRTTGAAALDDGLYRDGARSLPPVAPAADRRSEKPTVNPAPAVVLERDSGRSGITDALKGFLTSFTVTVVIGGMFVLAKALGWLG